MEEIKTSSPGTGRSIISPEKKLRQAVKGREEHKQSRRGRSISSPGERTT